MVWILSLNIYYSNFSFFRMKLSNYLLRQTKVNGWVWLLQTKKIGEFVSYELQQNRWVSILQAKNNVRLFSGKAHFKDYWAKRIVNQKALLSISLKQSWGPCCFIFYFPCSVCWPSLWFFLFIVLVLPLQCIFFFDALEELSTGW